MGNTHRFDSDVKIGKAPQRQCYPAAREQWDKGEKYVGVCSLYQLISEIGYDICRLAIAAHGKPCLMQGRVPSNREVPLEVVSNNNPR